MIFTGSFVGSEAMRRYCETVDYSTDDYRDAIALQVGIESLFPSSLRAIQALADGYKTREIAEQWGVDMSAVKNAIAYGRETLCARTRPGAIYTSLMIGIIEVTYPNGSRGLSTGTIALQAEIDIAPKGRDILLLWAMGLTIGETVEVAGLGSKTTYHFHARRLRDALEVPTNESAVRRAYEIGLLDPHNGGPPPTWAGSEVLAQDPQAERSPREIPDPGADSWPPRGIARVPRSL